jgi:hypothetical protein
VRAAAARLVAARLLLQADADAVIAQADASSVLRQEPVAHSAEENAYTRDSPWAAARMGVGDSARRITTRACANGAPDPILLAVAHGESRVDVLRGSMISGITARRFTYAPAHIELARVLHLFRAPGIDASHPCCRGAFPNKEDNEVTYGK